jgi:hypothetical protein
MFDSIKRRIKLKELSLIGRGSSRKVYDLNDGTVAKIAMNEKGIAQNKTEARIFEEDNGDCYPIKIFANIYSYSDDYKILIMEKCSKIKGMKILKSHLNNPDNNEIESCFNDLIQEIYDRHDLGKSDLLKPSSWGLNSQNDLVLIDYGLTIKVFNKYYTKTIYIY